MELLRGYVAGLNACIAAGVDVRTKILVKKKKNHFEEESCPIIRTIEILPEQRTLSCWYLWDGRDTPVHLAVTTLFSVEFNDLPNEIRDWAK